MCGIGGMLGQPDQSVLSRMNRLMEHRGPDGNGVFSDDNCGLAHTRLAILDISGSPQSTNILTSASGHTTVPISLPSNTAPPFCNANFL